MTSAKTLKEEHDWVTSHITDYLTDRADVTVTERMNRHLACCPDCAAELEIERRLREHIRTPATVDYTPGASFAKLKTQLSQAQVADAAPPRRARIRRIAVPLSLAASLAALAISLFSLTARHAPIGEAQFQTLSRAPQAQGQLHVGFSDEATSREIEQALTQVGGRIVSGPSAAGVFRVAIGDTLAIDKAIEILARQQGVRFVAAAPEAAGD